MQESVPALEMLGICKRFGGVQALDQVDFHVHSGEVTALIGENGAGKSTLMNILGGIVEPDAGRISLFGRPVALRNVRHAIELGIGFIHQELNVLENLGVADNILLGREPHGRGPLKLIDRPKMEELARPYMRLLGIDVPMDCPLRALSLAQRQMVEVAKALSLKARILIMDEPTSRLTATETENLLRVMRSLCGEGVAIIFISHRLKEVIDIADRVTGLRDGRNAGSLGREGLSQDKMVRLMIGRSGADARPRPSTPADAPRARSAGLHVRSLVTQAYPRSDIGFACAPGEILGFAGLVGAGRSEMARALFGIDPALGGNVTLCGKRVSLGSPAEAIAQGIYLIPEDRREQGLILGMSVTENITLPYLERFSFLKWVLRSRERKAVSRQCRMLNLKAQSNDAPVHHLSGGNQQKVALGKWLQSKPNVVIFDEPTRGIDIGAKQEIYGLIRRLASEGAVILLISSDLEELIELSDRIAVMHEGVLTGTLERAAFDETSIMRLAVGASEGSTGSRRAARQILQ